MGYNRFCAENFFFEGAMPVAYMELAMSNSSSNFNWKRVFLDLCLNNVSRPADFFKVVGTNC